LLRHEPRVRLLPADAPRPQRVGGGSPRECPGAPEEHQGLFALEVLEAYLFAPKVGEPHLGGFLSDLRSRPLGGRGSVGAHRSFPGDARVCSRLFGTTVPRNLSAVLTEHEGYHGGCGKRCGGYCFAGRDRVDAYRVPFPPFFCTPHRRIA
jgi:hypothetical protein